MKFLKSLLRNKKGAALVEYGLLVAGVALVTAAAVSIFGHKTNDLLAMTAGVLPGADAADQGPIASGRLIETAEDPTVQNGGGDAAIGIDLTEILTRGAAGKNRMNENMAFDDDLMDQLVVDTQ